jgi:hypothetical protein
MTYDATSDNAPDLVRLLITDTDITDPIFTDDQINQFLYVGSSGTGSYGMAEIRLASAYALRTIASSQVLTLKVGKAFDMQIDGSKVSSEIRAHADALQALAFADNSDGGFAIAEQVLDQFSFRERLIKEVLRLNAS